MTVYIAAAGMLLCIIIAAFFSSAEMAYSSANRVRLENLAEDGNKKAARALKIIEKFDDTLSTILIGNDLANTACSSLGTIIVVLIAGEELSSRFNWLSTLAVTVIVIIFSESMPKIRAKKNPNTLAMRYSGTIRTLSIILTPVVRLVVFLTALICGKEKNLPEEESEEAVEELQSIIETAEDEEVLDEDRSELVQAAIDFSDICAYEVMTARVDVCAIDADDSLDEIMKVIEKAPYSRIPVYRDSIDNIIGVLYLNHFLKTITDTEKVDIVSLLMPPCCIYKTVRLPEVLTQLRKAKQHLAIVTDEYGGTLGVVSMEDVLEQLVGEIWDESDVVEQEILARPDGGYELDGDMAITDFIELMDIDEDEFEVQSDTLGGWTVESFGCYPSEGDRFDYEDLTLTVLETDGRRVGKVLVFRNARKEAED